MQMEQPALLLNKTSLNSPVLQSYCKQEMTQQIVPCQHILVEICAGSSSVIFLSLQNLCIHIMNIHNLTSLIRGHTYTSITWTGLLENSPAHLMDLVQHTWSCRIPPPDCTPTIWCYWNHFHFAPKPLSV